MVLKLGKVFKNKTVTTLIVEKRNNDKFKHMKTNNFYSLQT